MGHLRARRLFAAPRLGQGPSFRPPCLSPFARCPCTTYATMRAALALALVSGASLAVACGTEKEFQVIRRNAIAARAAASSALATPGASAATVATGPVAGAQTVQAPTRTDEASAAQVTNPAQECMYYSYPPVAALVRLRLAYDRDVEC